MYLLVTRYQLILILLLTFYTDAEHNSQTSDTEMWAYPEDDTWPQTCQGLKQSPIAIFDNNVLQMPSNKPLTLVNYESKISASCYNDGHTVKIIIPPIHELYVIGDEIGGEFKLSQIHFHWTSEHIINGKRIPLEGHFVHIKNNGDHISKRDTSISENSDVQVLAVMYKTSRDNNSQVDNLIDIMKHVTKVGSTMDIEFVPRNLLPDNLAHYYRYEGSLTTPPCYEIVQWTIFSSMLYVSSNQYDMIQSVESFGGEHKNNFREIMPINNRIITFYNLANINIINIYLCSAILSLHLYL